MTFAKQGASVDPQATTTEDPSKEGNTDNVFLTMGDRKFTSQEEVVTKINNQDSHISNIESENATLRDEVASLKSDKNEEGVVLDELERMKQELSEKGLSPEQVQTLVSEAIASDKQSDLVSANHTLCTNELVKAYGAEYISELSKQAAELGMSLEQADEIANTNPKLFVKTFIGSTVVNAANTNTSRMQGVDTASYRETPNSGYEVKAPLSLRTTKDRADNFLQLLHERVAS